MSYPGYVTREPSEFEKVIIDYFNTEMNKGFDLYKYCIALAPQGDASAVITVALQFKENGSFSVESQGKILDVARNLLVQSYIKKSYTLYSLEKFSNDSVVLSYVTE